MPLILIGKIICLLLAVTYGISNGMKCIRKYSITELQMWIMGIGITGFITLQWLI